MFLKSKLEFAGMVEGDLEGQFCEMYSCKNIKHIITLILIIGWVGLPKDPTFIFLSIFLRSGSEGGK